MDVVSAQRLNVIDQSTRVSSGAAVGDYEKSLAAVGLIAEIFDTPDRMWKSFGRSQGYHEAIYWGIHSGLSRPLTFGFDGATT
jgi:hypothetical protein